jgi:very-short-patch-repair endonuclease
MCQAQTAAAAALSSIVMRRATSSAARLPRRPRGHRVRVTPEKVALARSLRLNPTVAYELLWQRLRRSKLGVRFRRRSILLGWVPDFWCASARVAVEIDYPSDSDRFVEHRRRDTVLARNAITILRFPAERVHSIPDQVAREIELVVSGVLNDSPRSKSLERTRGR